MSFTDQTGYQASVEHGLRGLRALATAPLGTLVTLRACSGRVRSLATAVGALLCWTVLACGGADGDLSEAIERVVRRGEGAVVDFAEITDFPWDRLHVFPPYTSVDRIHRELGFRWPDASRTGIESRDHFTLLVFTAGGEVTRFVRHPRNAGDFAYLHREEGYAPEMAVFVVHEEDHGGPWLVLRPLGREPAG